MDYGMVVWPTPIRWRASTSRQNHFACFTRTKVPPVCPLSDHIPRSSLLSPSSSPFLCTKPCTSCPSFSPSFSKRMDFALRFTFFEKESEYGPGKAKGFIRSSLLANLLHEWSKGNDRWIHGRYILFARRRRANSHCRKSEETCNERYVSSEFTLSSELRQLVTVFWPISRCKRFHRKNSYHTLVIEYSGDDSNHDNEESDASPPPSSSSIGGCFFQPGLPLSFVSAQFRLGSEMGKQ